MRNPYEVDPYRSASVPKGQCCYLLYLFCHPGGNVLAWGWPGTSRVGLHSEMLFNQIRSR